MSDQIIIAIISVLGVLLGIITKELFSMSKRQKVAHEEQKELHILINSRMTKMLELTEEIGKGIGNKEGRAASIIEQDERDAKLKQ